MVEPTPRSATAASAKPRAVTVSEAEFYEQLAIKRPELVAPLRSFTDTAARAGLSPEVGRTIRLTMPLGSDRSATAGYIESNGKLWVQGAWSAAQRLGRPDAGEAYLASLARLIGGTVRRYEKVAPEVIGPDGCGTDIATLLAVQDRWEGTVLAFREALSSGALPDRAE